jgi:hypothetical protein
MDNAQSKLNLYSDAIGQVENVLDAVETNGKKTQEEIIAYYDKLHEAIEARKNHMLTSITNVMDSKNSTLHAQLETLTATVLALSSACGQLEIVQQNEHPAKVLQLARHFNGCLKRIDSLQLAVDPLTQCDFTFVVNDTCLKVIKGAGEIETSFSSYLHSSASGKGIERAASGVPVSFVVTSRDNKGLQRKTGGDFYSVLFSVPDVASNITDNENGTYTVTFKLPPSKPIAAEEGKVEKKEAPVQVSVLLNGKHIVGSPYVLSNEVRLAWSDLGLNFHPSDKDGNTFSGNGFSRDPAVVAQAWAKVYGYQKAIRWDVKAGGNSPAAYHFEKATALDKLKPGMLENIKFTSAYKLTDPVIFNIDCV